MKLFINEYDYDWDDYDYHDDEERGDFEVYYATYYKDKDNYKLNLVEREGIRNEYVDYESSDDPWSYVFKEEADINDKVEKGEYPGLWVFHIIIPIYSNIKQIDVDRFIGRAYVVKSDITVEEEKIPYPDEYDEENYTVEDLSDYVADIIFDMNE